MKTGAMISERQKIKPLVCGEGLWSNKLTHKALLSVMQADCNCKEIVVLGVPVLKVKKLALNHPEGRL